MFGFPPGTIFHPLELIQRDPASGREERWVPRGRETWERIRITSTPECRGVFEVRRISSEECVRTRLENVKNALRNLLGTTAIPLLMPDIRSGKPFARSVSVLRRSEKFLVTPLTRSAVTEEEIRRAIIGVQEAVCAGSSWILTTASGSIQMAESPLHREVKELGDRLIDALRGMGAIIAADLHAEGAESICICLKHDHGSERSIDMGVRDPEYALQQFLHQNNLTDMQERIASIAGLERIIWLLEALDEGKMISTFIVGGADAQYNEQRMRMVSTREQAHHIFSEVQRQSREDVSFLEWFLDEFQATTRFFTRHNAEGVNFGHRVFGLCTPARADFIADARKSTERMSREENNRYYLQRMKEDDAVINAKIKQCLHDHLPRGGVAVLILGDFHFYHGFHNPLQSPTEDAVEQILQESGADVAIAKDEKMPHVRLIVVEDKAGSDLRFLQWHKK